MLFIKNLTKLGGSEIKINLAKEDGLSTIALTIGNDEPVNLLSSSVEEIYPSFKKSIEYVGGITNNLEDNDGTLGTCLLDNKPTEVSFIVKDTKIVIKDTEFFPVVVDKYDEQDKDSDVHYPRDMILFIVPNAPEENYKIVVDKRNLGAPIIVKDTDNYRVIGLFVKWPIWMKLKFPAYAYIVNDNNNGEETTPYDNVIGAIKLGYKTEKKSTKNQIQDVDVKGAVDYLTESFRILRENREKKNAESNGKAMERASSAKPDKNNRPKSKGFDNNKKSYNGDHNKKNDRNHGNVGFPSKFAGKGGNRKIKTTKNGFHK